MAFFSNLKDTVEEIGEKVSEFASRGDDAADEAAEDISNDIRQAIRRHAPRSGDGDGVSLADSFSVSKERDGVYRIWSSKDYARIIEYGGFQRIETDPVRDEQGRFTGEGVMAFEKDLDVAEAGVGGETVFTTEIEHYIPPQGYVRQALQEVAKREVISEIRGAFRRSWNESMR